MLRTNNNSQVSIQLQYPYNDMFDYITRMELINLDKQKDEDLKTGKGFIITASNI